MVSSISHIIIPINITQAKQVVFIREKIPSHLLKCIGISLSVSNFVDTRAFKVNHLAKVSINLNNDKDKVFETNLFYDKDIAKRISQPILLETPLHAGELITGILIDNNTSIGDDGFGVDEFKPYSLNIILICLKERI